MRVGVIGVGAMGRDHARVYHDVAGVELAAVADIDLALAEHIAVSYGAHAYGSSQEMLARERLDAVSVAVPTTGHFPAAMAALEAGCHVLVEKPIAQTVEEAVLLIEAARRAGKVLAVGHVERFNPAIVELRRRLEAGALGDIFEIHARRLGPHPARVRDTGVVIDLATHDLDLIRFLSGSEVVRMYAETLRTIAPGRNDHLSAVLRLRSGAVAMLEASWLTPTKVRELTVTGERGMFRVDHLTQDLYFFENVDTSVQEWSALRVLRGVREGAMTRFALERREPLRQEIEGFVRAVRGEGGEIVSGGDALIALGLALALRRSAADGVVLTDKEILDIPALGASAPAPAAADRPA